MIVHVRVVGSEYCHKESILLTTDVAQLQRYLNPRQLISLRLKTEETDALRIDTVLYVIVQKNLKNSSGCIIEGWRAERFLIFELTIEEKRC